MVRCPPELGPAGTRSSGHLFCFFFRRRIKPEAQSTPFENQERKMKKLSAAVLAFSIVTIGIPVLSHANTREIVQDEKKPELRDIKGSVKSTDGKITFISDEGGKSWDVINPDTLKDHVGHHVQLSAHVYPDKNQIHVMTVTML
jgi:hypothetical protein